MSFPFTVDGKLTIRVTLNTKFVLPHFRYYYWLYIYSIERVFFRSHPVEFRSQNGSLWIACSSWLSFGKAFNQKRRVLLIDLYAHPPSAEKSALKLITFEIQIASAFSLPIWNTPSSFKVDNDRLLNIFKKTWKVGTCVRRASPHSRKGGAWKLSFHAH